MWLFLGKKYSYDLKFSKMIEDLFGYGKHHALEVCCELGINPKIRLKKLKENLDKEEVNTKKNFESFQKNLEHYIKNNKDYLYENKLKIKLNERLEKIKKVKNRRSFRLESKLPVRGQRTQTNAKTAKKFKGFF